MIKSGNYSSNIIGNEEKIEFYPGNDLATNQTLLNVNYL